MPFCPKCKYEFVDGIKKCNECGCDLVDNLDDITNESDEEIMDKIVSLVGYTKEEIFV